MVSVWNPAPTPITGFFEPPAAGRFFDPKAYGMVQTLGEEFNGAYGSWWQHNGGRFAPTSRYDTLNGITPTNPYPLGLDAQFDGQGARQTYTWEGDPANPGALIYSQPSPSIVRMTARRARPAYPNTLKEWLSYCFDSSNGPIWMRPNNDANNPGDGRGHEQRYGYWEARCTLMPTVGTYLWPAWWLFGQSGPGLVSSEIDIFEKVGDEFTSTVHGANNANVDGAKWNIPSGYDFSRFRTYAVFWSPKWIVYYLDGIEDRRLPVNPNYAYFQSMFMLFSMAIGGPWPEQAPNNGTDAGTPAHPSVDLDYIRVWQFKAT